MNRSTARRAVRALTSGIVGMAHRSPRLILRGADLFAPAVKPLLRSASIRQLRAFFPDLTAREADELRAHMLREFIRSQILHVWMRRRGREGVRKILADGLPRPLPFSPVILGTFHMGPVHALGAAFEGPSMPPLLALRGGPKPVHERGPADQQRAAKFHEAAAWLRGGGTVLMALDPMYATRIGAPFFGGSLQLARGAFALSRITGVPIVPVVARWVGTKVDVVGGEPLAGETPGEEALAAAAARWLENYLRANPREISLRILDLTER